MLDVTLCVTREMSRSRAAERSHAWDLCAAGQHRALLAKIPDPSRRRLADKAFVCEARYWTLLCSPIRKIGELPSLRPNWNRYEDRDLDET